MGVSNYCDESEVKKMRRGLLCSMTILLTGTLGGCAGLTPTEQRTMTGAVGGTAAGAAIGAIAGNAALGAGIGAATGLIGGYLADQHKKAEERAYQQGVQDASKQ
jgi:hypothetical protein